MKKTKHATCQRMRAFVAVFCGVALCLCASIPFSNPTVAHAGCVFSSCTDGYAGNTAPYATSSITYTSGGKTYAATFLGWYLSGGVNPLPADYLASEATSTDEEDDDSVIHVSPYVSQVYGHGGYDTSGHMTPLINGELEVDHTTHHAFVSAAQQAAICSTLQLYPARTGDTIEGIEWYILCVPDLSSPIENKAPEASIELPETGPTMDELVAENAPAPKAPENPAPPATAPSGTTGTAPQPANSTAEPDSPAPTAGTLSTQCRKSETEAKIAELQAQGYEIVRVEKAPTWWR